MSNVFADKLREHPLAPPKRDNNLNPSGVRPFDKKVLVRMDKPYDEEETGLPKQAAGSNLFVPAHVARQTVAKKGNIIIPDSVKEQEDFAELNGLVVDMGINAFSEAVREASMDGNHCDTPTPGTRVTLARYAGILINSKQTKDGNQYRLVNDEDIVAILEDE